MNIIPFSYSDDVKKTGSKSFFMLLGIMLGVLQFSHFMHATVVKAELSESKKILYLPLKVNAAAENQKYADMADTIFSSAKVLKNNQMLDRQSAVKSFNYRKTFPPLLSQIISSFPSAKNYDYVAAGSLTKIGSAFSLDLTVYDVGRALQTTTTKKQQTPVFFYADANSDAELGNALENLLDQVTGYANRHALLETIKIKGNKKIDTGAILSRIKSKPGEVYRYDLLRDDLKNIFQLGFFDDVQIHVEDNEKGKIVTFIVKERAVIKKVELDGVKELKEDEIKEVITVKTNRIFNSKELRESIDSIKKLYKEKGYYDSKVTTNLSYPKEGQVNVTFVIKEGPKIYVKEIKLVGNTVFSDRKLKKVMVTSEKGFFSWITESGVLKRVMFQHVAARITAYYHDEGYIEAKVGEPEVVQEGEWLFITFNIFEGNRFDVGKVDVSGDLITDKNVLLDLIQLRSAKHFSRKTLREDILRITDFYAEKGYAFAEAFPSIDKHDDARTIDLVIDIRKGHLIKVNRILVKGNTRTRDKVIRREMEIKEGGIFDSSALRRSNQKLQRLNFFEEVNVSPEPTLEDNMMDVLVQVKEKPTGTFSIGAGYSSVDHMIFMAEVSQNNFLGRGQRLALQANISDANTRYNLSFTEPHIFDSKLLTGIDLYDWEREYTDYTKDSNGFSIRFGYPVWEKWYLFWSYGYDDTLLDFDPATASQYIMDSAEINYTSYVRLGLQRDTRDKLYDANQGAHYSFNTKYAGGLLGGDSAFTKLEGNASWYFPLFWKTTFHVKTAAGYVSENTGEGKLPVYEKFYLGGINTIRGFEAGSISPIDPTSQDKIGGDKMWYSNLEFIFPLVAEAGLKGLIFYDIGNVYDTNQGWDFSDIKHSIGYGFRWLSPMGPLRLEWGYNLDPDPGEEQSSWDFTIGGSF